MATGANGWLQIGGQDLTDRYDPRLWGTAGNLWANNIDTAADRDPRYWMRQQNPGDDSGGFQWQLRPEVAQQLNGRVQVGSAGVGGAGEVIDPSRLEYDETYGYLTRPENIRTPQNSGLSNFLSDNMVGIFAALANPAVAMGSGSLFQPGGLLESLGNGLNPADIPGNIPNVPPSPFNFPEMIPADSILNGAASGLPTVEIPGLLETVSSTPLNMMQAAPTILPEMASAGGGLWNTISGAASSIANSVASNPLRAAMLGVQAGGLLSDAMSGGQGGSSGGGGGGSYSGSGGLLGGNAKRPQWSPNQHSMAQLRALYPGRF